jgi:Tol biopolymer transport system component
VNLDGTGLTRLTANDAPDYSPTFSPDGTKIAYVSEAEKHYGVYVMNADGSDKRRLSPPNDVLEGDGAHGDFGPVFAPDGERVAATRTFYPWGEIIFFPTSGGPVENFNTKIEDAWERERRNNSGSALPPRNIRLPVFSGDGRKIAFREYPGINGSRVWIANADGSAARRLTEGNAFSLVFSPDGRKVAFHIRIEERRAICVINADGTGRRQLTKGDGDRDNYSPAFSPDGKKIIYESSVRSESDRLPSDIYIMNADGSEPRPLTQTPVNEYFPHFTPDGSKIVFYASPFEIFPEAEIYVMNADGSGRRFLAEGDDFSHVDFSLGPSLVEGRLLDSYGNWHDVAEGAGKAPPGE